MSIFLLRLKLNEELFIGIESFVFLELFDLGTETVVFLVILDSTPKFFWECSRRIDVVLEDSGYVVASFKLVKLGL